jgi:hypothetical protein
MFDFKKKVLNPLISETKSKIDDALKTPNTTARIENLLSAKEDADTSLFKISGNEACKAGAAALLILGSIPFFAAATVTALLVGVALFSVFAGGAVNMARNADITDDAARNLKGKIDIEVTKLATVHPQEAVKSPRFLKALKERFNLASASETEVNQLLLALGPTPTPAAAAPAAKSPTPYQGGGAGVIVT